MDSSSAAKPAGDRRRLAGRSKLVLAAAAAALAGVGAVVVVITANSQATTAQRPLSAKPFALVQLGGGRTISLAALAGRPVIINFFASWCGPCKRETPMLASFYRSHHGKVLVIGVDANDETGAALKFVGSEGVRYPVAFDPSASVAVSYGVLALPQSFFLNARHMIVLHIVGGLTARELTTWAASLASHGPG